MNLIPGRLFIFLLLAFLSADALAQAGAPDPSFTPGPPFISINRVALQSSGKAILAGLFTNYAGATVSNLARLNLNGAPDGSFNAGRGLAGQTIAIPGLFTNVNPPSITALAVQPDDRILVGGLFDAVDAQPRTNLARLQANGALDASFDPRPDNSVTAILPLQNGGLLVGGPFTKIGGVARKSIALLQSDGKVDPAFVPNWGSLVAGGIQAIALQADGKIVVAGSIAKLDGFRVVPLGVARLDAAGNADPSFVSPTLPFSVNTIVSVAVQSDGKILVAGGFPSISGAARSGIARLNSDGSVDPAWTAAGASGGAGLVQSVRLQADGKPVIAGLFTSFNGVARPGFARLNPSDGSLDNTFAPAGISTALGANAMVLQADGKPLLAGAFSIGATPSSLIRLIGDSSSVTGAPKISKQPIAQTVPAGSSAVLTVTIESATPVSYQWRLDGTNIPGATASSLTLANLQHTNGGVYSVLVSNSSGSVTSESALINPVAPGWPDLSFPNTGADGLHINSLALDLSGKTLVAGAFTKVGGFNRNRVARLNADGSVDASFDQSTSLAPEIHAVAAQSSGKPIVAGLFGLSEAAYREVARLNLNGSLDTSFNPGAGPNDQVFAVAVQPDDKIVIGGFFNAVDGIARSAAARLNANGSLDSGFAPAIFAPQVISAIAIQPDGKILLGGKTGGAQLASIKNLLRFDTNGVADPSFNPGTGPNEQVRSIALAPGGKIVIGGQFTAVNGIPRNGVARLHPDGSVDASFNPGAVPVIPAFIWSVAVQPDGKVIVAGAFQTFGGQPRRNIARLNNDGSVDASFAPASGPNNAEIKSVLLLPDGTILAGGDFTTYDRFPFNRLVRLHGGGTSNAPELRYTRAAGQITFTWSDASWDLQSSATLTAPNWSSLGGSPHTVSTTGNRQGFFRLIKP